MIVYRYIQYQCLSRFEGADEPSSQDGPHIERLLENLVTEIEGANRPSASANLIPKEQNDNRCEPISGRERFQRGARKVMLAHRTFNHMTGQQDVSRRKRGTILNAKGNSRRAISAHSGLTLPRVQSAHQFGWQFCASCFNRNAMLRCAAARHRPWRKQASGRGLDCADASRDSSCWSAAAQSAHQFSVDVHPDHRGGRRYEHDRDPAVLVFVPKTGVHRRPH